MTSKLLPSLFTIIFFFYVSTSLANVVPSTTLLTPLTACSACHDPIFCISVLPSLGLRTIPEYSRLSIAQSLVSARKYASLVDSSSSNSHIGALEDCRLLLGLNIDLLEKCHGRIGSALSLLDEDVDDLLTMLSTTLTNQETCLEGLESSGSANTALYKILSKGCKEYSVSLGLFNSAWGRNAASGNSVQGRKLLFAEKGASRQGQLPLKMLNLHPKVFETVNNGRNLGEHSDAVIVREIVDVNKDGSGKFTTINDAIAAAPNNTILSDGYYVIYVAAGVYEEYVSIAKSKKNLMIIGDGIDKTVITGNRNFIDGSTTFNSATLAVVGQGFVAVNITVRNTAGAAKHQAVAVRNGADLSAFYRCSFEGYQDTLYAHSNRQFYRECNIYGTVDFIFGNGAAVLQNCNIYPRLPLENQFNAVTAQGRTDPSQNTGISIHNCVITAAPDLAASSGATKTYLGRPWKEYSRTVYMQSFMSSAIDPSGWRDWNGTFALSTLYYAEYRNSGPGSDTANRVTWPGHHVIGYEEAMNFTVSHFITGKKWLPATGVPFDKNLV